MIPLTPAIARAGAREERERDNLENWNFREKNYLDCGSSLPLFRQRSALRFLGKRDRSPAIQKFDEWERIRYFDAPPSPLAGAFFA
jgi:hypothetical protein